MRKILLVSGDSFTDSIQRSAAHPVLDTSWPKWPELLAKKLDMDVINLGSSGAGNNYIYSSLHDSLRLHPNKINSRHIPSFNNNNVGLVVAAWSQCHREDWQETGWRGQWKNERIHDRGDLINWVRESLRIYSNFQMLCKNYNLPYIHTQMIPMYVDYIRGLMPTEQQMIYEGWTKEDNTLHYPGDKIKDREEIERIILEYDDIMNNFIEWPIARALGGSPLNIKLFHYQVYVRNKYVDNWPSDYVISDQDNHPNAKGHELIAETMFKYYEEKINS